MRGEQEGDVIAAARTSVPAVAPLLDELLSGPDAARREAARVVANLALRIDPSADRLGACAAFLAAWPSWRLTRDFASTTAVMANVAGIVANRQPVDFVDFAALSGRLGARAHADLIREKIVDLDDPEVQTLGSALFDRLTSPDLVERLTPELGARQATTVADTCGRTAVWFLVLGVESDDRLEPVGLDDPDHLSRVARGGIREWRRQLMHRHEHPWSFDAERLLREARAAGPADPAGRRAQHWLALLRRHAEEQERESVARHIRRLIEQSGLSQRDFAVLIGTSPSRLSTYATGKVMPSAALLLRMMRVAREDRLTDGR
jgi:DNA-binding transcriptional regulator YiaG